MDQKLELSSVYKEAGNAHRGMSIVEANFLIIFSNACRLRLRTTLEYEEKLNNIKFIKECQERLIESFGLPYNYMEEYIRRLVNAPKELVFDGIHLPYYKYIFTNEKGEESSVSST